MKKYKLTRVTIEKKNRVEYTDEERRKLLSGILVRDREKIVGETTYVVTINFGSTDPDILRWFKAEVQQRYPTSEIKIEELNNSDTPINCHCELKSKNEEDKKFAEDAKWWLLNELCQKGWEPFTVKTYDTGEAYYLRYEQD